MSSPGCAGPEGLWPLWRLSACDLCKREHNKYVGRRLEACRHHVRTQYGRPDVVRRVHDSTVELIGLPIPERVVTFRAWMGRLLCWVVRPLHVLAAAADAVCAAAGARSGWPTSCACALRARRGPR